MFRDAQEELKRLEEQLLAEEDLPKQEPELGKETRVIPIPEEQDVLLPEEAAEEEPEPERQPPRRKKKGRYIGRYEAYNSDRTDTELPKYSEEVRQPKGDPVVFGLSVLALILMAAILGVLIWWFIRFRGLL